MAVTAGMARFGGAMSDYECLGLDPKAIALWEGGQRVGNESFVSSGTGYHGHNWGDAPTQDLIHDWYWSGARIGPFTVIASDIVAVEDYGSDQLNAFLLAKDGKIVADDAAKVRFESEGIFVDGATGKPAADIIRFIVEDEP